MPRRWRLRRTADDSTRLPAVPARAPDIQTEQPTLPQQALLFDLHGIVNPVHSWPAAARQAGYPRPFPARRMPDGPGAARHRARAGGV